MTYNGKPTSFRNGLAYGNKQATSFQITRQEDQDNIKHISQLVPTKRFIAIPADKFMELPLKERAYLMRPILPEQGLAMIYAQRGLGKTYLALSIAVAVAAGVDIFSKRWTVPTQRKVLFIDGEMTQSVLQERLKSLRDSIIGERNPLGNLKIITPDMQEYSMPDLSTAEGQAYIEEHLEDVDLIIIDNLSALCCSYKENEADSWVPIQQWLLKLKRRGKTVLIVHHANKNGSQRGTSRKEDVLDTVIELRGRTGDDHENGASFEVHYSKSRHFYGNDAKPFILSFLKNQEGNSGWVEQEYESKLITEVQRLKDEGLTQRETAEELKVSLSRVNRILKQNPNRKPS